MVPVKEEEKEESESEPDNASFNTNRKTSIDINAFVEKVQHRIEMMEMKNDI